MEFRVNGETIDLGAGADEGLGPVLARADGLLEQAGSVIVALTLDGRQVGPDDYPAIQDLPAGGAGTVDILTEPASEYKAKAIGLLLELLGKASRAAGGEDALWVPVREGAAELLETLSGLFSADELSFVQAFAGLAASAAAEASLAGAAGFGPGPETRRDFGERVAAYDSLFRERLAELRDPVAEMRRTASLYADEAEELRDLPVHLQTGEEGRAMKTVLLFIEIFNKVIRLMPGLRRTGVDTGGIRVDGLELPSFYASFNEVLRGLSKALEDKDSVLIGDLAEYEVAPRMGSLFAAMEGALPR